MEEVLVKVNKSRSMLNNVWDHKCQWIGHALQHDELVL